MRRDQLPGLRSLLPAPQLPALQQCRGGAGPPLQSQGRLQPEPQQQLHLAAAAEGRAKLECCHPAGVLQMQLQPVGRTRVSQGKILVREALQTKPAPARDCPAATSTGPLPSEAGQSGRGQAGGECGPQEAREAPDECPWHRRAAAPPGWRGLCCPQQGAPTAGQSAARNSPHHSQAVATMLLCWWCSPAA